MPSARPPPDAHILLLHDAFLRRVARGLVAQAADADDLVQATYERALAAGPRADKPVHAWLRVIAQRLAWRRGVREGSRRVREARATPARSVPTPADVWEREDLRRHVVRAVLALPERDREVLILRYLKDLSLREVAGILGLPTETVRTRLKRALARLRTKLDRDHPETLGALALFVPRASGAVALCLLGGVVMKKALAVGVVLLLLVGVIALSGRDAPTPVGPGTGSGSVGEPHLAGRSSDVGNAPPSGNANAGGTGFVCVERVFSVHDSVTGLPVEGAFARVPTRSRVATVRADAQSRIHVVVPEGCVFAVEFGADGYIGTRALIEAVPAADTEVREIALIPLIQSGNWRMLEGRVVNERARPVEGTLVWTDSRNWWTHGVNHTSALTDAEGRFQIVNPEGRGHVLRAHHPAEGEGMHSAQYADPLFMPPIVGPGARDVLRAAEDQRNIRIVLRPARRLPLAIQGSVAERAQAYTLEVRPAESRFGTVLAVPRILPVRNGDEVALGVGKWALLLRAASGDHLLASPLHIEVDASVVYRSVPTPTPGWDDATWQRGEVLSDLPFGIDDRSVRVQVLADGVPVVGARVRLESSRHVDSFLVRYTERDGAGGILGAGLLGTYVPGRREIDTVVRVGRTDEDGIATFEGWVPEPALVWVRGVHVVNHFEVVETWPRAPVVTEVNVVLGGTLDVRLPDWLDRGISLRDLQTEELIYARVRDLPLALPPGRYKPRVRQWSRDGRTSLDRPLAAPIEVHAGMTHLLDLRDTPPPLVMVLHLRPLHAHGDVRIRQRGRSPPQDIVFQEGVARWERVSHGRSQAVLAWSEHSGTCHEHRVMLTGLGRADEDTTEIEHDLNYRSGSIDLEIESQGDRPMTLVFRSSGVDAPYDGSHTVRVVLPARATTRTTVHDLPAGTYRVYVGDEQHTADRDRVDVVVGQTALFRSTLQRQTLRLDLSPADTDRAVSELEGGWVYVAGPAGNPGSGGRPRRFSAPIRARGICVFEKLPPGTYEATASWPGDGWQRGIRTGVVHTVPVGTIQVERGENRSALRVPTREP